MMNNRRRWCDSTRFFLEESPRLITTYRQGKGRGSAVSDLVRGLHLF